MLEVQRVSKEKFCPCGTYRQSTHDDSAMESSCEKGHKKAGAMRACGWRANPKFLGSWRNSGKKINLRYEINTQVSKLGSGCESYGTQDPLQEAGVAGQRRQYGVR